MAFANVTEALVLEKAAPVPAQLVVGFEPAGITRPVGSLTVRLDCVRSKPLVLPILTVNVEVALGAIAAGDQLGVAVGAAGAAGFTLRAAGQAVEASPADLGAELVTEVADSTTVSTSTFPTESVTVSVSVPLPPLGMLPGAIVTCALPAPLAISAAGAAVHAKLAIVLPQEATLPEASAIAEAPRGKVGGTITPIGFSAALTALSALTMPVPHCVVTPGPGRGQEQAPLVGSVAGQTASGVTELFGGNAVALDSRRAINWAGVRFALTERISAAMPATIGAEKLVPRFGFCSFV